MSQDKDIDPALAASVAQEETLRFFDERLRGQDRAELHNRVMRFMSKTKPGDGPAVAEVRQAIEGSR